MQTKQHRLWRKALSLVLTVLMVGGYVGLFSGLIGNDPFGTKQTANAITSQSAGSYSFTVTFKINNNGTNNHDSGWGQTTEDTFIIAARTKKNNGRNSATYTYDYWTSTGSKTWSGGGKQDYDGGFPDGFYMMGNDNSIFQGVKADITKIVVSGKTVWTGTMHVDSTTNEYHTYVYASGQGTDGGNDGSYGYTSTSTKDWPMPSPTVTFNGETSVTTDGTTQKTYSIKTAKDQYGVNWGFDSVTWTSSSSLATIDNNGVATFGDNNGKAYDVTFTPTLVHSSGNKTVNGITVHVTPNIDTLSLNTAKTAAIVKPGFSRAYYFTPTTAGKYVFFTYGDSNTGDTRIYINKVNSNASDNLGDEVGYNDDYGHTATNTNGAKIRDLIGTVNNQSYTAIDLEANTKYVVRVNYYYSNAENVGSIPLKVCKGVNITFNGTGGLTSNASSFEAIMPAGHTMKMNQTGFTRTNHDLIAWSTTGSGAEAKSCMASQTITIPSSDTKYYALWYPTNATALTVNSSNTATVSYPAEIQFYKFTPTETRKYLIYSTNSNSYYDPYLVVYNASSYQSDATNLKTEDDGGNSHHDFVGELDRNFYLEYTLEAGTTYLIGVKLYHAEDTTDRSCTGSYGFCFQAVYDVTYDANGGSGAPEAQKKYYNKSLTLSSTVPTRDGYVFEGWGTSADDKTVDYPAGGAYTANSDQKLYAIWSRDITNNYYFYTLNDQGELINNAVKALTETAYNAQSTITFTAPNGTDVTTEYTENGKTWTLTGWNEQSGVTWGGSSQQPSATNGVKLNTAHTLQVAASTPHTFMPVYALKTTEFYANFNYYLSGADAFSKVTMSAAVNGDATTGAMPRAAITSDGANNTVLESYAKNGYYYKLTGWTLTEPGAANGPANPVQGTPQFSAANDSYTLTVPGSSDADKHNTNNLTPVELYPVYELDGTALNARFYYYDKSGAETYYSVSTRADSESATTALSFPQASNLYDYETGTDYTAYTKDGVTYTLLGWNCVTGNDGVTTGSANDSSAYQAFGHVVNLLPHDDPATDYYEFFPVYQCTTTVRYYYYTAAGVQASLTRTADMLKNDTVTPDTASVAIPLSGFGKSVTLNGRTFSFCGWRTDTQTDAAATVATTVSAQDHTIRDEEYAYYAVYQNDALALSYNTEHDGVTAVPTPATQNKTQYISAATGNADIDNVAKITFDVNPNGDVPAKTGYTFIGWGDTDSEEETYDYAKTGGTLQTRIDKTIFARFSVNAQNVKFVYYDGSDLEGAYKNLTKTVSYDDELRADTGTNTRYVVTAPTVKLVGEDNIVNTTNIVHANDKYHYVFKEWVRSDDKGVYTASTSGINYTAKFKNVQEDITVQATYSAFPHHYEDLTSAEVQALPARYNPDGDSTASKDATCVTDGYQYMKCADCGHVYKKPLPKFDHKDENGNAVVTYSGYKAPTCEGTGKYAVASCALCGDTVRKEDNISIQYFGIENNAYVKVASDDGIAPAAGHAWPTDLATQAEWYAATCTENGYYLCVCANNSMHTRKVEVNAATGELYEAALGHDPVVTAEVPATCTADGVSEKSVCRRCSFVVVDSYVIPATGHTTVKHPAIAPTCEDDGNTEYYECVNDGCGKYFTDKAGTTEIALSATVLGALGHEWVTTAAAEATCTTAGHTAGVVCSRCGEPQEGSSALVTQEALGHDPDDGVHTASPSGKPCVDPGYTTYSCQRDGCDYTEVVYDDLTDHVSKEIAGTPATCTEMGKSAYTVCRDCGRVLTNYKWLPKTSHRYTEEVAPETPATCTAAGVSAVMKCANCDATIGGDEIAALEHNYSGLVITAATCEADGSQTKFCKRCGDALTETIEATGHTSKAVDAVAATCTQEGKTAGTVCEKCGEVLSGCETVELTPHNMGEEQVEREATCALAGLKYTECDMCGYKKYEPIEKLPHTEQTTKEAVAPTCTAAGLTAEITCSACGEVIQAQTSVTKLEHQWERVAQVDPTCTEKGTTAYDKCGICGVNLSNPRDIQPAGHQWGEWQLVRAATCTEDGARVRYCTVEGCEAASAVISADQNKTLTKLGHKMTKHEAKAASCGVEGNVEYYTCTRCAGKYYKDAFGSEEYAADEIRLAAYTHSYSVKTVVAPTCTAAGYDVSVCSLCGDEKHINEAAALGHTGGTATCIDQAVCERCHQPYGNLGSHSYEVTYYMEGTCIAEGSKTETCIYCGDEISTTLPLGNHAAEIVSLTEPTCTEPGSCQYACRYCGEPMGEETIPATGHVDENGDGNCDVCGQSMTPQTEDPGNGTTTGTCGKCGRNHVGQTGGIWGYDGFVCKLIAFFRSIVRMFSK